MRRRLSLRARLVLGVVVLAALALVAADIATYTSLKSFLLQRTDSTLEADHHAADSVLKGPRPGPGDRRGNAPTPGLYIQIRNLDGKVIYNPGVSHFPGTTAPSPPELPAKISLVPPHNGEPDAVRYFTVPAKSGSERYRVRASIDPNSQSLLIVATSLHDVDSTLHRLLLIALLVTLSVLGAIVLLGLWLVRLGLRPLEAIGKTADAITAGDLSRRVERAETTTEVGRLGLALNVMLAQIEDSDRRLRRFVADASHELRTPLAAVRAYAELFRRGASGRPQDLERAMTGIERESERMSALVEDLLLLARLDGGRPLEREPVELDALAAEAVETAHAVDPARPIELQADHTVVLGDRDRLRQVIDNLLANVRAHTPTGSPARVAVGSSDGNAVLEVTDSGPGLDADELERVFERFFRADASRSRTTGGIGLGLAIVAAVAEAHGGTVSARSEPGGGATFRITLPLLTDAA